jgi:hypothetical protein
MNVQEQPVFLMLLTIAIISLTFFVCVLHYIV